MADHPISHIELPARDAEAAAKFYNDVFDWEIQRAPEPAPYVYFQPQSGPGGGFAPVNDQTKPGDVLVYIGTTDVEASLARVEAAGGRVVVPKTDIPMVGSYAVFEDPTGNRLGLFHRIGRPRI